jgi:long-chain acyl-CoA synthetase
MYKTLVGAVLAHGEDKVLSEKIAVGFKNVRISYADLCHQMKAAAFKLRKEYDVKRGDIIMITAMSKPEYVVMLLGAQYLGAVTVPLDKKAKEQNILDVYHFIQPKLLVTDSRVGEVPAVSLKNIYQEIQELCQSGQQIEMGYDLPKPDETAEMLFTTGTTGTPKGAMLTYGNIYASTHNTWCGVGMEASDVVLIPLPLNHSVGMRVLRTALYIGATVVIQNGFTFAKELERNIVGFGCTALVSVPASVELIMRQMQEKFAEIVGGLRYLEIGAGSLSYDMKKKLTALLPDTTIYNTWGSTETGGAIFLNVSARPDKYTALGKPVDGIELKVVDPQGNEVEARDINTAGRMVLKGDMQMAGYYNLPEENKKTLVDGWLYTNDMVYLDEEGFVYMLGRADAIINVGGEKVSPIEVENIAQEFGQIRECGCIGVKDPDDTLGFVPVLYVVPEGNDFDSDELIKFLSARMEAYKIPHRFIIIEKLPRNRMQKLDYKELRRMWEESGDEELMNPVIRNIYSRHSVRDFTKEQIPKAKLEMIVKAGIYAPSGHNMQTWKFTVLRDQEKILEFRDIVSKAAKENNVYFYGFNNPTALILVSNDRRNDNCIQDSSCAAENIMLAANSYGIGSVWLNPLKTISDVPKIRALLDSYGIPKTHIVWSTVALGYPAKEPKALAKKMGVVQWV